MGCKTFREILGSGGNKKYKRVFKFSLAFLSGSVKINRFLVSTFEYKYNRRFEIEFLTTY